MAILDYMEEAAKTATTTIKSKTKLWFPIILSVVGLILLLVFFTLLPGWEALAVAILMVGGFLFILFAIDKWVLVGYDIIQELKDKNIAVAIAMLSIAVVIAGAVIGACLGYR